MTCPARSGFEIGLTYVYGIGRTTADKILAATGINPDTRVKDLTREEEAKIRDYIDEANIIVEGDLRRNVALDIKRPGRDPVLPRHSPSQEPALPWPAHQDQMHVPARVPSARSPTRRSKEDLRNGKC